MIIGYVVTLTGVRFTARCPDKLDPAPATHGTRKTKPLGY